MHADEALRTILKDAGYSITGARRAVFHALSGPEPLTMRALVAACPDIDRASVYRTIELFETLGIVQRLQQGWKYRLELSDAFTAHHHHLTCTHCGASIDLEDRELEQTIAAAASRHGYRLGSHQLEVQGTCGACQSH